MSGKVKLASYIWWPSDFMADEHVVLMSLEEEAVYRRLLDHQALHGSIPADPGDLARIVGKGMTRTRLSAMWRRIAPCFVPVESDPKNDYSSITNGPERLVNRRLARDLADDAAYRAERSESGKKGGEASAKARAEAMAQAQAQLEAQAQAEKVAKSKPPSPAPSPSKRRVSRELADLGAGPLSASVKKVYDALEDKSPWRMEEL